MAVVVPRLQKLEELGESLGLKGSAQMIAGDETLLRAVRDELEAEAGKQKLAGIERVKKIFLECEVDDRGLGFTSENGLATPTTKLKRKPLTERYAPQLEHLYSGSGPMPVSASAHGM